MTDGERGGDPRGRGGCGRLVVIAGTPSSSSAPDRNRPDPPGGPSAAPVVLSHRQYSRAISYSGHEFNVYARFPGAESLLEDLYNVAVWIPYGRVDGLGRTIRHIVHQMERDIDAHVPHPVRK